MLARDSDRWQSLSEENYVWKEVYRAAGNRCVAKEEAKAKVHS